MSRISQRRLLIGLVLALVVVGAIGVRAMTHGEPTRFSAMFTSTVGLYPGNSVQILGVPVGKVTAVEPEGKSVKVSMELDPGESAAAGTAAVIIAPTLVSDRFVQLTKPYVAGEGMSKLAAGSKIPLDRTAVPAEIDDLYSGLQKFAEAMGPRGANKHGALSKLLRVAAKNLKGQGQGLNTMMREFGKASDTMSNFGGKFFKTISNFQKLSAMLAVNDDAVGKVNKQFADVAGYLAKDRHDLGRAAKNLSGAMAILDDFIRDNREHLKTSVKNLEPTTKILSKRQKSLSEMVRLMPLLMHNLLDLYDPAHNVLVGRGDLNEATLWSKGGLAARTSKDAPPTLLPGGPTGGR